MNEKLPYERLIADKLQNIPLPDEEQMWRQMRTQLDVEMPVSEKRRPGGGKWWWISGIVIVMVAGVWVAQILNYSETKSAPAANHQGALQIPAVANKNMLQGKPSQGGISTSQPERIKPAGASIHNEPLSHRHTQPVELTDQERETIHHNAAQKAKLLPPGSIDAPVMQRNRSKVAPTAVSTQQEDAATPYMNDGKSASEKDADVLRDRMVVKEEPGIRSYTLPSHEHHENTAAPLYVTATGIFNKVATKNTTFDQQHTIIKRTVENKVSTIVVPDYVHAIPDIRAEKKKLLREIHRNERREERALAKSYKTYHSFWGETTDRWFAAGIAPYQNIAVGAQQPYHFNSSAGKNIITDYIPSPYLQLHITNRIYLLGEFQFNSPQATPSLLLSQKNISIPAANAGYTESTYLRKLYYFNMPVSFYYSPVKNFYVGSGLQFSSFSSGLADVEQRSDNNVLLHTETIKLKDDSLSNAFSSSEWRYLVDANYYVNRFMIGFRYNQALNRLVDPAFNSYTSGLRTRNQAFQFYLRYNLVVSGRKK